MPPRAAFSGGSIYGYASIRVEISKRGSLQSCVGGCRKHPHFERNAQEQGRPKSRPWVKPRPLACWCGLVSATFWVERGFWEESVFVSRRLLLLEEGESGSGGQRTDLGFV